MLGVGLWIYVSWCFVNGVIAHEQGRGGVQNFLLSAFVSPLVGWAYLMGMPRKA
jgi:hypothetical protein